MADTADEKPDVLRSWGVWPATAVLFVFAWMDLVWARSAAPGTVATAALAYTAYLLVLAARVGGDTAMAAGDVFTTVNRLFSAMAPWGRHGDGRLGWRGWLRALPVLPAPAGLTAFVVVIIGAAGFHGLSETVWWRERVSPWGFPLLTGAAGILAGSVVVGAAYLLACWASARSGGADHTAGHVAKRFIHTLVPVAFAQVLAHYFPVVLFDGQQIIGAVSDPFGMGWDLFGTAHHTISYFLAPAAVWYLMVGVIVVGHAAAIALAHDRALADFPPDRAADAGTPLLALMVALGCLGIGTLPE